MNAFRHLALGIGLAVSAAALSLGTADSAAPSSPPVFACLPDLQLRAPQRCAQVGPGAGAARRAREVPTEHPVAAVSPDPGLGFLPFEYVRVGNGGAPLYSSPQEAAAEGSASDSLPAGFLFLSYTDVIDVGGTVVYSTSRGYLNGGRATEIEPLNFHGLAFRRTPDQPFGWIISGTFTQGEPGGAEDWLDHWLPRLTFVRIYDVRRVGEWDWYEVAPGEWVEQRSLAKVVADPARPDGVEGDRWISVNLYEQTVTAYDGSELVYATLASTGRYGYWTQPGLFQVWAKLERDVMTGGISAEDGGNYYYLGDVPWVLYFDQSRALHGTYWHARFGSPSSRGCVNLAPADARWMFEFAGEGTWVYVWDPSGATPTDPALYGSGGA
jgi:hypothetical protein